MNLDIQVFENNDETQAHNYTVALSVLRRDKGGHPTTILCTRSDVTKELLRQIEAKNMLLRYQAIFNTVMVDMVAYDAQGYIVDINQKLASGPVPFGIVMIDMNNLKEVNDAYGHSNGDIAIKKVSKSICEVFAHSPVFRMGGDEFAVVLMNSDYGNIEKLNNQFLNIVNDSTQDDSLEPWEKIDAAIGYAIYDETIDNDVQGVLERADKNMYRCKRAMHIGPH